MLFTAVIVEEKWHKAVVRGQGFARCLLLGTGWLRHGSYRAGSVPARGQKAGLNTPLAAAPASCCHFRMGEGPFRNSVIDLSVLRKV